ncbi:hypothetical protein C8R44DRAFT_733214 [Mycena epipterygia]|nr:hypothetical protein C8R44DRAFT_733214 [Mycena epipterygia]
MQNSGELAIKLARAGESYTFCWAFSPTSAAPLGTQYWARTQVGLGRMNKMKYIINSHELGGVVQQTSTSGRGRGCWAERWAPDLHAATGGCRAAIANEGTTWESRRCLEMEIDVDSGLDAEQEVEADPRTGLRMTGIGDIEEKDSGDGGGGGRKEATIINNASNDQQTPQLRTDPTRADFDG